MAAIEYGLADDGATDPLIRRFHSGLKDGGLFSNVRLSTDERSFLNFMEWALGRYVDGKQLEAAFGLKKHKGRVRDIAKNDRDLAIAAFVVRKMREKINWERAIGDAANKFFPDGKGSRACEEAYAGYKDILGCLPNEKLELLVRLNDADLNA